MSLRGALASGFDLMLSGGMLFVYVVGSFTTWETQALACACVPLLVHGLLLLVVESPLYLVQAGRLKEAGEAIGWLFGFGPTEVSHELGVLQKSALDSASKPVNFDRVVLKLSVLKPILICFTVMFFYTMCAYDAVIFYTVDIFKSTGATLDPQECAIILGAVQVVSHPQAALLSFVGNFYELTDLPGGDAPGRAARGALRPADSAPCLRTPPGGEPGGAGNVLLPAAPLLPPSPQSHHLPGGLQHRDRAPLACGPLGAGAWAPKGGRHVRESRHQVAPGLRRDEPLREHAGGGRGGRDLLALWRCLHRGRGLGVVGHP